MTGKRFVIFTVCLAFLLSACGTEEVPVPELVEMAAVRESYRPVEKGVVGSMESFIGHVVPTEYPYFWENAAVISEIMVNVGDHVEPGDVLAIADIESLEEQIDELKDQKKQEQQLFEVEERNYQYAHEQLEFESTYAWETNQTKEVEKIKKQLEELEENHSFDVMLHEYKQREFRKSIEKCEKTIEKGTLVSQVSGKVVYRKDFSKSRMVNSTENVVVIADETDCYIEIEKTVSPKERKSGSKEVAFVYVNGERYLAEEYAFSQAEFAAIDNRMQYPLVRYRLAGNQNPLQMGDDVIVCVGMDVVYDVPVVGVDSINEDLEGSYVYVDNNGKREARRIKIGKKDSVYAEILSGLSEGELVYYSSKTIIPQSFEENLIYEVQNEPYGFLSNNTDFGPASVIVDQSFAPFGGTILEVLVDSGSQVSQGDLICTLKTTNGSAKLSDLQNEETNLNQQHQLSVEAYEKQEKEFEKYRQQNEDDKNRELAALSAQYNAGELEEEAFRLQVEYEKRLFGYLASEIELQYEQFLCSREKEDITYQYNKTRIQREYNKIHQNNDGQGIISVYANCDGCVIYSDLNVGKPVEQGDFLFKLMGTSENLIAMTYLGDLPIGHEVEFVSESSGKRILAHVVGYTGNDRVYVTEGNDMIYMTTNQDIEITTKYYLALEGKAKPEPDMKIQFSETRLGSALVIPKDAVNSEQQMYSTSYFVWCLKEDVLTKKYIKYDKFGTMGNEKYFVLEGISAGDKILLKEPVELVEVKTEEHAWYVPKNDLWKFN